MTRSRQYRFNAFDSYNSSRESKVYFEGNFAGVITDIGTVWQCEDGQVFEGFNDAYDHQMMIGRAYILTSQLEIA